MQPSNLYKLISHCCLLLLTMLTVRGQEGGKEACMQAMKTMVQRYQASSYLSFNVTYRYATEQQPSQWLDSLKGSYRLNGKDYWYSLDSTEVASYKGTCVLLFKEDKLMYLVPPRPNRQGIDFIASMDSLLSHLGGAVLSLSDDQQDKKILLSFGEGRPIRSIEYSIDKSSGYITRIIQAVKSDQLYDASVRGKIEGGVPYAIVEMDFSNYRTGGFDDRQLDTAQYFKKDGSQYVSVAPYDEYKIFLGAPNL